MTSTNIRRFLLINCICFSVLGNNTETDAKIDAQAWNAITNKWFSGDKGKSLLSVKELLNVEPIKTNVVLNGSLSTIMPNVRIYQLGIINLRRIQNQSRDTACLVIDGSRLTFIETDEAAIDFFNSNRCQNVFSAVRAVQEVLAFGELRGYTIMTEEKAQILKSTMGDQSKISSWSFSVREGEKASTIEATFITMYRPDPLLILWSKRFVFKFKKDGKMILEKIEDSGFVGGFL
jgi:hypothetical protein